MQVDVFCHCSKHLTEMKNEQHLILGFGGVEYPDRAGNYYNLLSPNMCPASLLIAVATSKSSPLYP